MPVYQSEWIHLVPMLQQLEKREDIVSVVTHNGVSIIVTKKRPGRPAKVETR